MSKLPLRSLSLILSPYHVGLRNKGPGAGPAFLKTSGLDSALLSPLSAPRSLGLPLHEIEVEPVDDHEGEIGRSFEVGEGGLGCVWFDAHDDLNTPDTVMSGYFDSMPIAMLAGQCWEGLLGTVPGHQPMDLERLVHVGMRDVNDLERARVAEAGFDVIWGSTEKKVDFGDELGVVLQRKKLGSTMVHFDVDSLDASIGHANRFAAPGGLLREDIIGCFGEISGKAEPVSLTVASFDPSYEGAGNLASVAVEAIKVFLESLVKSGVLAKP
ncbi:putative arginase [Colletotrichum phormii]|uniref:Arginase n=1 Tax=Colletotrichum phormii TaxID=359342 RepID=A0AAJ0E949_9PEZI|nr:putative arginase [Colletotrichum phormii]KAK1622380.1 putative arginase [Colletotrichum phormii]